jgi:hypothetical protein
MDWISGGTRSPLTAGARRWAEESIPQNDSTEGSLGDGGAWWRLWRKLRRQVAKEKRRWGQRCKRNIWKLMRSGYLMIAAGAAMQRVVGGGVILTRSAVVVSAGGTETGFTRSACRLGGRTLARQAVFVARVPVVPHAKDINRCQALSGYQEDQKADKQQSNFRPDNTHLHSLAEFRTG